MGTSERIREEKEEEMQRREEQEYISQNSFPITLAIGYVVWKQRREEKEMGKARKDQMHLTSNTLV